MTNIKRKYFACQFSAGDSRNYTYHYDDDGLQPITVGDTVVVDTKHGEKLVLVVTEVSKPVFETKPILFKRLPPADQLKHDEATKKVVMDALRDRVIASIGHNNPPSEIDMVKAKLDEQAAIIEKKLESTVKNKAAAILLGDDDMAGRTTETIKLLGGLVRDVEADHKRIKEPYLQCGKAVDGWKNKLIEKIDGLKAPYVTALKNHLDEKENAARVELAQREAAARAEAQALADMARQEAQELISEAVDSDTGGISETAQELLTAALNKEQEANILQSHAENAKPADLAKTRAGHGAASASQSTVWIGEVESYITIDLEPLRAYLSRDAIAKAVQAYAKDGGRQLRGAKIYQTTKLNVR